MCEEVNSYNPSIVLVLSLFLYYSSSLLFCLRIVVVFAVFQLSACEGTKIWGKDKIYRRKKREKKGEPSSRTPMRDLLPRSGEAIENSSPHASVHQDDHRSQWSPAL